MWRSTAKAQYLSTCLPLRHKHSAKSTFHVQLHCAHTLQISMTKPLQSHPSKEIISCTVSPGMKSGLRRYMWLYKGTVEEVMKALFIKCLITTSQSTTPHYPLPLSTLVLMYIAIPHSYSMWATVSLWVQVMN